MTGYAARADLLLLADGRFPAGGYAHSGGLEPAVKRGEVTGASDVAAFIEGRLRTTGLVAASFAAAACRLADTDRDPGDLTWLALDQELDARTPSPAQRDTSRQLGRQLIRALAAIDRKPGEEMLGSSPHFALALGLAHGRRGQHPGDAAVAVLYDAAASSAVAAVRVLSIDSFSTHGILARTTSLIDELAVAAVEGSTSLAALPATAGPLQDTYAQWHRQDRTRLFAS